MKIAVIVQNGEGCGHTIGCGIQVEYFEDKTDDKTDEEFILEALDCHEEGDIESITISTIEDKKEYNIEEFMESHRPAARRIVDAEEKASQAELDKEQLLSNFRKNLEEAGVDVPEDADLSDPVVMHNLMFVMGKKIKKGGDGD